MGSHLKAARLQAKRAEERQRRHGSITVDALNGLTFLQRFKVQEHAQQVFDSEFDALVKWSRRNDLLSLAVPTLDTLVAQYMDHLYWSGYPSAKGSRALAALHHRRPALGKATSGSLPASRAALAGFRRHSHSVSRLPLAKPWMLGILGISLLEDDAEFAVALLVAWDALLRLPGDLTSMTKEWVVGPGSAPTARWALLLYPEGEQRRSKTHGCDEGVLLLDLVWSREGGPGAQAAAGEAAPWTAAVELQPQRVRAHLHAAAAPAAWGARGRALPDEARRRQPRERRRPHAAVGAPGADAPRLRAEHAEVQEARAVPQGARAGARRDPAVDHPA